jgi:hypothetical protein
MNMVKLSEYFFIKYAAEPDTSFGVPITPERTRILKDKLILVYDKLNAHITQLPEFQALNKELKDEPYLKLFNSLIDNFVINIENSTLKEAFSYGAELIDVLNKLRKDYRYSKTEKEKKAKFDMAVNNIQDTIWKESKNILNIHDLRGMELDYPELFGIIRDKIVPTWNFGPMRSPVIRPIKQRTHHTKDLIKRLQQELTEETKK